MLNQKMFQNYLKKKKMSSSGEEEEDNNTTESIMIEEIMNAPTEVKNETKETDGIVAPSEIRRFEAQKSKKKGTKKISIYTKNMQSSLPDLKKIAGTAYSVKLDQVDPALVEEFKACAKRYSIISIMLYLEKEDTEYPKLISLTAPTITLVADFRSAVNASQKVFPEWFLELVNDPNITKVVPGPTDWAPWDQNDYVKYLKVSTNIGTDITLTYITDFIDKLNVIPSGKDVSEHMKFIYWIFQLKFENSIIGANIIMPLSEKWRTMVHKYGSLLCFIYLALQIKYEDYIEDKTYGTNPDPIYLETILHDHIDCYSSIPPQEIQKELIGPYKKYPNPPLPNIPRSTKRPQ